jgi:N-acetylmuramoyl-L-alanine amidase
MSNKREVDLDDLFTIRWGTTKATPESLKTALDVVNAIISGSNSAPSTQPIPPVLIPTISGITKVALVVGHNSKATGACAKAPINKCEFAYNNEIVDAMIKSAPTGIEYKKFNRVAGSSYSSEIDKVYAEVNTWNPVFVVELHFNGSNGQVNYTTTLHAVSSTSSKKCAQIVQDVFVKELGFKDSGLMPVSKTGRGGRSLYAAKAPSVLTEPFFGDNESAVKKVAEIGIGGMASIYNKAVSAVVASLKS